MIILSFYKYFSFLLIFGLFIHSSYSQDSNKVDVNTTQGLEKIIYLLDQSKKQFPQNDSIALAYGNEALKIAEKTANQDLILTCYNQLLLLYYQLNDIDAAKDISRQAEQTVFKAQNTENKAIFFQLSGQSYKRVAEFNLAEYYFKKSIESYQQVQKTDSLYTIYLNLAKIHQNKHEYDTGANYAFKSLALAKKNKNLDKVAESRKAVGEINAEQKNYGIALENFLENLSYYERKIDTIGISQALNDIALTYYMKGENELSIDYSEKSLALRKLMGNKSLLAENYNNLSLPYNNQKNWKICLVYLNKALELVIELNDLENIPFVLTNIGNLKFRQGFYKESIRYYEEAFNYQKKNNKLVAHLKYNGKLSEVFSKKGEHQKALNHYKLYNIYKDSIAYQKQQKFLSELNVQYESEKKENQLELNQKEIKLLEANQEIKDIELNNQQKWLSILTFGFVLVMFLLLFVFKQMKSKNKAYKILVEKNLEIVSSEKIKKLEVKKTKEVSNNKEEILPKESKYADSQLSELQKKQLLEAILLHMEDDKPYLEKSFNINILAKKLNSSRSYVSQVINEELERNFNQFINEYRIKEARQMLSVPENKILTIESIAFSVGFGSKSSFNNAFKNYTGITPSFYLKSLS